MIGISLRSHWLDLEKWPSFGKPNAIELSADWSSTFPSLEDFREHLNSKSSVFLHITQPCIADISHVFKQQIDSISQMIQEMTPQSVSFHFAVEQTSFGNLPGMMPVLTTEQVDLAKQNIDYLNSLLPNIRVSLENISVNWMHPEHVQQYLKLLSHVIETKKVELLLDLSNLEIMTEASGYNFDLAFAQLSQLPINYAHIGGISKIGRFLVDFHGGKMFGRNVNLLKTITCPKIFECDQNLRDLDEVESAYAALNKLTT